MILEKRTTQCYVINILIIIHGKKDKNLPGWIARPESVVFTGVLNDKSECSGRQNPDIIFTTEVLIEVLKGNPPVVNIKQKQKQKTKKW